MNRKLRRLYDASSEDMTYGIGTMDLGTGPPAPIICIRYRDCSREQLEVVRDSFESGIVLTSADHTGRASHPPESRGVHRDQ